MESELKKRNLKIIGAGVFIYILFLVLGIFFTKADWISVAELLAYFIILPFLFGIIIFGAWHWSKRKKDTEQKEERKKKIDASNIIPWSKKIILERWHSSFEPEEPIYKSVGKEGDTVPIMVISGYAATAGKRYNIFVNLFEPDAIHSVVQGFLLPVEIERYANDLAYNPRHSRKETIQVRDESGVIREITRELPDQIDIKKSEQVNK